MRRRQRGLSPAQFKDAGAAHPAADAHRDQAVTSLAAFELVQDGNGKFRASGSQRVTQSHRAAVDVDALSRQRTLADDGERLTGEGFVEFDKVYVLDLQAGLFERLRNG